MKIRSITYFDSIRWPIDRGKIQIAGEFIKTARRLYQDQGFEVQTTRLASVNKPLSRSIGAQIPAIARLPFAGTLGK